MEDLKHWTYVRGEIVKFRFDQDVPDISPAEMTTNYIRDFEIGLDMNTSTAFDPSNGDTLTQRAIKCALISVGNRLMLLDKDSISYLYWAEVKSQLNTISRNF